MLSFFARMNAACGDRSFSSGPVYFAQVATEAAIWTVPSDPVK